MNTRICHALAALLVATGAPSLGADEVKVSVTVKDDGKSCAVTGRGITCTALPAFLSHDLAIAPDSVVTVAPESCGEAAVARASSVAKKLREAGFTKVFVVGFLSEPKVKCAP